MAATSYLQILGIICGQIVVGVEGDWIGRRVGLVQDALVMTSKFCPVLTDRFLLTATASRIVDIDWIMGYRPTRLGYLLRVSDMTMHCIM